MNINDKMNISNEMIESIEKLSEEIGKKSIKEIMEHLDKNLLDYLDLKEKAKKLCELVFEEKFYVNGVVCESYATSFTPRSEICFGSAMSTYNGGFASKLVLDVLPDNQSIPVNTLHFRGFSAVRAGDNICAKMPKFKEVNEYPPRLEDPLRKKRVFYVDRDFLPEESAIELAVLSDNGDILRIDRAVDYKNFK
ncbi:MAG: hypothetical protein PHT91_03540 [Candidatus Nanoarchaeia archaeon]|nr:hypothetical protein [Candidatus Nanoarchaeia archaeon]MDD5499918.1 hypothetical protein [Candidatus Nanoarchaeia archaeon]